MPINAERRKGGKVNSSERFHLSRAVIKDYSSSSLLQSSVPKSMNAIFFSIKGLFCELLHVEATFVFTGKLIPGE